MEGIDTLAAMVRLRARLEMADAEIRTLEEISLPPRARTIIEISKIDVRCATTNLDAHPDALELARLGQWLEMIESHLQTVRRALTTIAASSKKDVA